jgi:hypothetical protein
MTAEEKLATLEEMKNTGNEFFKAGAYAKALRR